MNPQLNLHLYAIPTESLPQTARHESVPTRSIAEGQNIAESLLQCSFEDAVQSLESLDQRMFIELDGSFVWTGGEGLSAWQIDGMIYDRLNRVSRVEIKGQCPLEKWRKLVSVFDPTGRSLVAHLLDQKCFVPIETLEELWS